MKKRNITLWTLTFLGTLFGAQVFAQQNVNMPFNTGVQQTFTISAGNCLFNFFDNGGPTADYSNNSNPALSVVTFAPGNAGAKVRATFNAFAVEASWDAFYIRDGNSTASPLFASGNGGTIGGDPAGGWWGTQIAPGTSFTASAGNASGALTFQLASDTTVPNPGWDVDIFELPVGGLPVCAMTAPANLTVNLDPATCLASATTPLPTFSPDGCQSQLGLQYSVNGGAPVVLSQPFPATVTIPGLMPGNSTVRWQSLLASCPAIVLSTVTQTINAAGGATPPTFTVCPSNVTVNLAPGECSSIITYDNPCARDCTGFPVGSGSLTNQNLPWTFTGQGVLYYNVANGGASPIIVNSVTTATWGFAGTLNFNVFSTTTATTFVGNTTNPGAWTLNGSAPLPWGNAGLAVGFQTINLTTPVTIPSGSSKGFMIAAPIFFGGGPVAHLNGNVPQTNGTVTITAGQWGTTAFGGGIAAASLFGGLTYTAFNQDICFGQGPASGPGSLVLNTPQFPSGATFPRGVNTVRYTVTDSDGLTAVCQFTVTVNEFPNPTQTLTCNDFVYVSLDADCTELLGADNVLEGGAYGCYDDYIVQVDRTAPYGNGPWEPALLGPSDVGKTYAYQVIDPDTGNKCWGNLKVEDKLPPVLVCPPSTILCNQDDSPGAFQTGSGTITASATGLPITATENQVKSFTIPVTGLPNNAVITDVDFRVRISGTPFDFDLRVDVQSPGGAVMQPWVGIGGCGNVPLAVIFDSDVPLNATCAAYTSDQRNNLIDPFALPPTSFDAFDGQSPNGNWLITFGDSAHDNPGNDNPNSTYTFEIAQLLITYVAYGASLPNGLTLSPPYPFPGTATKINASTFLVPQGNGTPAMENCSDVTLTFIDSEVQESCTSGLTKTIKRKWTAKDASGNTSTCIQDVLALRPTLDNVAFPPDYDGIDNPAISCEAGVGYPYPDVLEDLGLQGYPYVFGEPDGCNIGWSYTDVKINECDGTFKVLRKWAAVDWCTGTEREANQIIKIMDNVPPVLACPANMTVSTDPYNCCAIVDLPDIIIEDNCSRIASIGGMVIGIDPYTFDTIGMFPFSGTLSNFPGNNLWDLDTMGVFGSTVCLPIGTHTVVYQAEDDCGNTRTCTFRVTVADLLAPEVACTDFTTVAVGVDDPYDCYGPAGTGGNPAKLDSCQGAGVSWIKAKTFDQGSYDNCNNLKFTIQRVAPYSACVEGLNSFNGHPACDDLFPDFPTEYDRAVGTYDLDAFEGGDSIKFYCCEVGDTQMIRLRVFQLAPNGIDPAQGPDGTPLFNECMVMVQVQDKLKPVCYAPANVTVSCEAFDPSLWAYGKATVKDNCCLDETESYQGQCGLRHTAAYGSFDTVCNRGTITRTFQAFDCHGQQSQCQQRIFVNYNQEYFVRFPNDVIVTKCNSSGNYGEPLFFGGEDCELMGVSYEDQVFTVVPDACMKIERTWTIINWCTYNVNGSCINVPNPNPNATTNSPQNLPGPTVSPLGTPAPWAPTNTPLAPGQASTNFSQFYDKNANCYRYKQIIKIIDTEKPEYTCAPPDTCDFSLNDTLLWNRSYWWDPAISSHNLCEGETGLTVTVSDSCSGSNVDISFLLFLDLNGDGVMETVVNSNNVPAPGTVNFNNFANQSYSNGTPQVFDDRPVPPNDIYRWAMHQSVSGDVRTASVQWKTFSQMPNPNSANPTVQKFGQPGVKPQLPHGKHKIKWTFKDGCGNEDHCEYVFQVKDCKAPTVVCHDGLAVNLMPGNMVALWATDLLKYAEDNCTPPTPYDDGPNQLKFAIIKSADSDDATFPDGQASVTFDCDDLGEVEVQLWAQDAAGNSDYCEATVTVQDNTGAACNPNAAFTVAGALKTEGDEGVSDANVHLQAGAVSDFEMSDDQGQFQFVDMVPSGSNYTVTPTKDDNPLNGVSTFDLVLISRHILGLQPLGSPYKMIAADANKSNSITTFDIVEIRKLILGIYSELPGNTSWRFVDKGYSFPQPTNPFAAQFPENISATGVTSDHLADHFVGVKIGDVNNTALANAQGSVDDRTAGTLLFDVDDRQLKAGEVFTAVFKASDKAQGFQFTLNLSGLETVSIEEGEKVKASNFGVFADALTASVEGAQEFAVTFRATKPGKFSEMLGVSSRITRAEAYSVSDSRLEVALRFNGQGASTISGVGFELYQNQPNPFVNKTVIGFHLPEAAQATLSVFDESGRMLFTQKGNFAKGHNAISVDRALLNTTGMMYYKLETATDAATKKMIQSK